MNGQYNPSTTIYVYVLTDPRYPDDVRYVGVTDKPKKRLRQHIANAKIEHNHRAHWINSLLGNGLTPIMTIIDEADIDNWQQCEIKWIAHYRGVGCKLVNSTDGGEGSRGVIQSEEARKKTSERMKGVPKSDDHRRKLSESQKNKPPANEETRKRMSESASRRPPVTEKTRRKKSESMSGEKNPNYGKPRSEDTRYKISDSLKKPVLQYDKFGYFIRQWDGVVDASKSLSIDQANISACCLGVRGCKSAGGFIWRYTDNPLRDDDNIQMPLDFVL